AAGSNPAPATKSEIAPSPTGLFAFKANQI
ncbi:hypothetical protein QBD00_003159, partial [Ochrobactrum sp. AN78]|nr:hypothetical protein [Ochrobactrum sp. AN78]